MPPFGHSYLIWTIDVVVDMPPTHAPGQGGAEDHAEVENIDGRLGEADQKLTDTRGEWLAKVQPSRNAVDHQQLGGGKA